MSQPNMSQKNRPLSPHLQIYRPQITTIMSILHRATGAGLAFGAVFVAWWLLSIVYGIDAYRTFYNVANGFVGQFVLFGFLWAFIYHFLNGLRHLMWDTGRGIDMESVKKSGYAVAIGSVVLSLIIWGII